MANKFYPFSTRKYAHDIEFYADHIYLVICRMESGEIPMDTKRYNRLVAMREGKLMELRSAIAGCAERGIAYLTGEQIGLAKKIVFWAESYRAELNVGRA